MIVKLKKIVSLYIHLTETLNKSSNDLQYIYKEIEIQIKIQTTFLL